MASSKLNHLAPEFVPGSVKSNSSLSGYGQDTPYFYADPSYEEAVTSEELEELEACEEWVRTMAELDEMEREHLIATALSEAEPSQILEVEMRAFSMDAAGKRTQVAKRKGKKH
ncbi:hypothetical protein Agub_g4873 [Astrephomene gubernaculifera]|uniref:Uncharacterized protein n=1 Tax=Astrephomene gubernaculifera TaxID=47775 RepID=A0AAD3HKB5_9CHLO|nr:hypothetical protein Agub_g4873 [Astrephomene gubernaculifera]